MSRAKFDFSGYDPEEMRKKRPPSPKITVNIKEEDDMEILTGQVEGQESNGDLDQLNTASAQKLQS